MGIRGAVMKVKGQAVRSIQSGLDGRSVDVIDQTRLPHQFEIVPLHALEDAVHAIKTMMVRGAPLIGATASYGVWLAMLRDPSDTGLAVACQALLATRPTAVNLRWAIDVARARLSTLAPSKRGKAALALAEAVCEEDVALNLNIGRAGLPLIERQAAAKGGGEPVNILTHCNAGWLATVDWGTATAPIYMAHDAGIPVHVWVDETRPRNQGGLTAWELANHGVPYTVIVDNAGGHYMQKGKVDMVLVGTDRTTASGDVCNKIGTYLKALAASDNGIPFYVSLPSPTIDWSIRDGLREMPIEERRPEEVTRMTGRLDDGDIATVTVISEGTPVANPAFDVTPARLVTGLITERGIAEASRTGLFALFPEQRLSERGDA